ncbi:hypothetical protein PCANC_11487 [Puccinia coronata f. sp. avenae]|uniref:Core-binding (CB) domain-containing protein n=1 Tax=Puccinia coronata f. sp. avenae TaxID=200324 RepID=A0A2N5UVL3_9BASI|nr:hypothetical protein PCANC_11487 [Puccinia coronata f. sp. avenae]
MFIVWTDNTTTEHAIHKRKSGNRTVNDKWKLIQTLLVRLQANLVAQRVSSGENRANDLSRGIKADLKERNRPTTLKSYDAAVRKFLKSIEATGETKFVLPATADQIYHFCFWAGQEAGQPTEHNVTAKRVQKYLYGLKAWHLYHDKVYPATTEARVAVMLRASAKEDAAEPEKEKKKADMPYHLVHLTSKLLSAGPRVKVGGLLGDGTPVQSYLPKRERPAIREARTSNGRRRVPPAQGGRGEGHNHPLRCQDGKTRRAPENPPVPTQQPLVPSGGVEKENQRSRRTWSIDLWVLPRRRNQTQPNPIRDYEDPGEGGALFRYAMEVPIEEIKKLGRWESDCYQLYIRPYSAKETKDAKRLSPDPSLWEGKGFGAFYLIHPPLSAFVRNPPPAKALRKQAGATVRHLQPEDGRREEPQRLEGGSLSAQPTLREAWGAGRPSPQVDLGKPQRRADQS